MSIFMRISKKCVPLHNEINKINIYHALTSRRFWQCGARTTPRLSPRAQKPLSATCRMQRYISWTQVISPSRLTTLK